MFNNQVAKLLCWHYMTSGTSWQWTDLIKSNNFLNTITYLSQELSQYTSTSFMHIQNIGENNHICVGK